MQALAPSIRAECSCQSRWKPKASASTPVPKLYATGKQPTPWSRRANASVDATRADPRDSMRLWGKSYVSTFDES
jgi:hypothetical protein